MSCPSFFVQDWRPDSNPGPARLTSNGCIDRFLDKLPEVRGVDATSLSFDGAIEWKFDEIYCGLGKKDVAELVAAWDNLMIRDE